MTAIAFTLCDRYSGHHAQRAIPVRKFHCSSPPALSGQVPDVDGAGSEPEDQVEYDEDGWEGRDQACWGYYSVVRLTTTTKRSWPEKRKKKHDFSLFGQP